MRAVVCPRYGEPEILRLEDRRLPEPSPDEVLVRVRAANVSISDCVSRSAAVKPLMWLPFRAFVGWRGPRNPVLGLELSGEVEAVGARVTQWRPGDEIFAFTGRRFGAYAEYSCLREGGRSMPSDCLISRKPSNVGHAEAATLPSRSMLAFHCLERANIRRGQNVLIYGASSGVGVFAVQLAKHLGAHVTGVTGPAHLGLVRSLGAYRVLDYTVDGFEDIGDTYDVVFDAVGTGKTSALKSRCLTALRPQGKFLSVDRVAKISAACLGAVRDLVASGVIRPVLDRTYRLDETAQAHRYVESRHKGGGVAVEIGPPR